MPRDGAAGRRPGLWSWAGALGGFALAAVALAPALTGRTAFLPADLWMQAAPWRFAFPTAASRPPANPHLTDQALLYAPQLWVVRESLARGSVPLWNPAFGCGEPLLPTALSAPFAPTTLPVLALPWPLGFAWSAWLRFGLMWAGAFLFGRALGLSRGLATALAVSFSFLPGFIAHFQQPRGSIHLWLPWMLLAVERTAAAAPLGLRRTARAALPLAALQLLALLGGHPGDACYLTCAAGIYAVVRLPARPARTAVQARLAVAVAVLLGCALAAPLLGPFAGALADSATLAERRAAPVPWLLPAEVHRLFWDPFALGSPVYGHAAGPWRGAFAFEEEQQHIGVLPWLLLAGGLAFAGRRVRADAARLAGLGVLALACGALAYGWEPLRGWLAALPPFSFGANPRLSFFAHASLVTAAALLARSWLEPRARPPRPRAICGALLAVAVAGALLSLALAALGAWAFRPGLALAAGAALLAAGRLATRDGERRVASALLPLLLLAELAPVYRDLYPQVPRAWAEPARAVAALPEALRADPGRRVASQSFTPPNLAALLGSVDPLAYSFPVSRRYDAFAREVLGVPDPAALTPRDLRRRRVVAGLARTCATWLATTVDYGADQADLVERVHEQGRLRVYRLRTAPPWAAWHARSAVARVPDLAAAAAHLRATLERTPEPIAVEDPDAPGPAAAPPAAGLAAAWRSGSPQHLEIELPGAAQEEEGVLVLRTSYDAGWRATSDAGHALRVLPAQVRFLAVEAPAGTRRIVLRYAPPHWRAAWIAAAVALLVVGAAGVWSWSAPSGRKRG